MAGRGTGKRRFAILGLCLTIIVEAIAGPLPAAAAPIPTAAPEASSPSEPSAPPPPPTERVELRTASSSTVDNHDGTLTTTFAAEPIFYQPKESTAWLPVAVGFGAPVDGVATSDAAPTTVAVAGSTDSDGFLRMSDRTHTVAVSFLPTQTTDPLAPLKAVTPTLDANVADYPAVMPGIDLRIVAGAQGAKSFLVLRQPPPVTAFSFAVRAPGVTFTPTKGGAIALTDAAGAAVGSLPRPYAVDSSAVDGRGGGAFSDAVSLTIQGVQRDAAIVTLSVDALWLKSAVYPVYLDPSVNLDTDTYGDAFVSQAYPTQNFGDYVRPDSPYYHELWLGTDPGNASSVNNDYLKFDTAPIAGMTIDAATLVVYPYWQYQHAPTAVTTWVDRVNAAWTESGLTWNTKPAATSITSGTTVEGSPSAINVASLVASWASGAVANNGLKLHENGNNSTYWKRLKASEQSGTDHPRIAVTYHIPTATAAAHNWSNSRTRTWTYADPSGHAQSHYQVEVSSNSAFSAIISSSGTVTSAATSWAIPGGVTLTSGSEYWYRVKVKDGTSWSAWSSSSFVWDSAAPTGSITLNGGAVSTDSSAVAVSVAAPDPGTTAVYANDGRSLSSIAAPCGAVVCASWATPQLATDHAAGAVAVIANSGGSTLTWHAATVDAGATLRPSLAMDVMRDNASATYLGLISDDNDGLRFLLTADASTITQLYYTATSTPGAYTFVDIPDLPFTPGTWYRLVITTTGPTFNLWWYARGSAQPAAATVVQSGVYLPKPRLHLFQKASTVAPAVAWLDDLKVSQSPATSPYGSGATGVRLSPDNVTWGPWTGYADTLTYSLPAGSGTRTVYAQLRDGVGNVSASLSDSIDVAFANLGRQPQHRSESWGLGTGDEAAVNVASGNLVLSHPLVSLPYRGGNTLDVAITYNAQEATNLGLGPGWQLNLQRRLVLNGDGTVTFVADDGARYTFSNPVTVGSITTYTRPLALYGDLVQDASAGVEFTLTYRDLTRDRFDIAGSLARLASSEDRHANAIAFSYDGAGNLATASDPAGRQLTFAWDSAPTPDRLTSIADWAWIDGAGVVQPTATGAHRLYRLFYDASGNLAGWSDPLNTSGSCPTGGSHLTCLTTTAGLLTAIAKTQTYTTVSGSSLGTATRTATTSIAYAASRVASVTDAGGNATSFTSDAADRVVVRRPTTTTTYGLVAAADPYARVASVWRWADPATELEQRTTWDASYPIEPATVTDNFGAAQGAPARTLTYTYQAGSLGLLSRLVEPLTASTNRWTDSTYNANRDLTQTIVSQDGSGTLRTVTRFCYDAGCTLTGAGLDQLAQIDNYVSGGAQNADTNVTTDYGSDAYGQRTSVTRHNRDATGAVLDDRADHFVFDANGNQTSQIVNYADGVVTSPGDDVTPNPSSLARTDLTTVSTYDTAGNRISSADPRRAVEAAKGTSLAAADFVTRWTFDALDQQLSEDTPTTPGISSTCPPGNPTCRESTAVYDELGGRRTATDFGGVTPGTRFDATGRLTATYAPPANAGDPWAVTAATNDADGRSLTNTDARQTADASLGYTQYLYDPLGRQISAVEATGTAAESSSDTAYDGLDRRVSYTVGGQPSTYAYDIGGRVVSTDDGFACTTETFDYRDHPTTTTSGRTSATCSGGADWRTTAHTLDGLARLTRDELSASATGTGIGDRTTDLVLDAVGNPRLSSSRTGGVTVTTTATLTLLDQTVAEQRPDGSTAKTTFDPAGNPADACFWAAAPVDICQPVGSSWTNPPTQVTSTAYDARNQRISFRNGATNALTTYDPDHNYQVAWSYQPTSNGREVQTHTTYDDRHRTAAITVQTCLADASHACTDTPIADASDAYAYDDADNVTTVTESRDGGSPVTFTYCYDGRGQLIDRQTTSACSGTNHDEHYAYDAAGNRTSALVAGTTTNYAYDAAGRLCAVGATTCASPNVAYDSAGRTASWNGWTFSYDAEGRMLSACRSATCAAGFDKVTFSYDGAGHRTRIATTSAGGVTASTDFSYAGDAVVAETLTDAAHPTPTVVRRYTVDADGAIVRMTIPGGEPEAGEYLVTWNGHGDALNLLRLNADGTTTLANSYAYSSWGAPTTFTHNGIGDLGFRFLYVGKEDVQWDNAFGLGLLYMHARHYAPALGRFLQPDPAAIEESPHAYAANNPITAMDADGMFCQALVPITAAGPIAWGIEGACWGILAFGTWWAGSQAGHALAAMPRVSHGGAVSYAKPSRPGRMNQEVKRGQAPRSVVRVDGPHNRGDRPHVHLRDPRGREYARNQDGSTRHGAPRPLTRAEREWLNKHGWR